MIVEQFEFDLAFGEEADKFKKFLGGNGAGAFFLDLGFTGSAHAELKVGGRDRDAATLGLNQKVGENRNRGFAFHHALRGGEFVEQRGFGYAEFHELTFLTCGTGCRHVAFPRKCDPLSYCTRFLVKYKARKWPRDCGYPTCYHLTASP